LSAGCPTEDDDDEEEEELEGVEKKTEGTGEPQSTKE